jgi:hypothetical protein
VLCGFSQLEEQDRVQSQRPPKKGGPQSEFAWLVDEGVRAYQRQRRLPSLESSGEAAAEIAWLANLAVVASQSFPKDEDQEFRAGLRRQPTWVSLGDACFDAAGMSAILTSPIRPAGNPRIDSHCLP